MRYRSVLLFGLVLWVILLLRPATEAQQPKTPRIGYLTTRSARPTLADQAFRQGLQELGYIDGKNIIIETRYADGKPDQLPKLAAELVDAKIDIIVASGAPPVIRAAQEATRVIPIIMRGTSVDPVQEGLVRSLAKPGGNITGLTDLDTDLHPKRLELLTEVIPGLSRVAVLWSSHQKEQAWKAVTTAAQAFRVHIQSVEAPGSSGLEGLQRGLSSISRERPDAMLVVTTELFNEHRRQIIEFTIKNRLPAVSASTSFVDAGGLMAYGANSHDLARRTAFYVDKILRGAKPGDLPVEQATKFDLLLNLKTAKQIGLTIPPHVLARADRVVR